MESDPWLLARIWDFTLAVVWNWKGLVAAVFLVSGPALQLLRPDGNVRKTLDKVLPLEPTRRRILIALCFIVLYVSFFNTYDEVNLRLRAIQNELKQAILNARPSVRDSLIRWKDGDFSPSSEREGDPFAITIKNIGSRNAINLTITFTFNINVDELVRMALTSDLFMSRNIEGDAKKLTVPLRFGDQSTSTYITLTGEHFRKRDQIPAQGLANEITVPYPPGIKDEISLWLLITSHSQGRASMAKREQRAKIIGDPQTSDALRMKLLHEQIQEMERDSLLVLPDMKITISYGDFGQNSYSNTYAIRSIYKSMMGAEWVIGIEPRTLSLNDLVKAWLASKGIAYSAGDYRVGQPEGGVEAIQTWNVAKLGVEPTMEQLQGMASFARNRQQVLLGGTGTLSYEDQDNPSEEFFNAYKNQGLFTPSFSSAP